MFCSPEGKERNSSRGLPEVSTLLRYFVRYCLQLGHNCLLICFRSWFCVYLSCKQLPKVSLPLMRTLASAEDSGPVWLGLGSLCYCCRCLLWLCSPLLWRPPLLLCGFSGTSPFYFGFLRPVQNECPLFAHHAMLTLKHCMPTDLEHQQLLLNIFSLQKLNEDSSWKVWRFLKCTK